MSLEISLRDALLQRASQPRVTDQAPTHAQVAELVQIASNASDHTGMMPWRLIELRGSARERLGAAMEEASGKPRAAQKPLRAPLLITIVSAHLSAELTESIPLWEQDAVAVEVAQSLSLLLLNSGWGSVWRSGRIVESAPVRAMLQLADNEQLLGWLYVGGLPETPLTPRERVLREDQLTVLDA